MVALVVLGGCSLLTGASDLRTEPGAGVGAPGKGGDGGTDPSNVEGGASPDGQSPTDDGGKPGVDGGLDASPNASVRAITFESGSLTGVNGGDSVMGSPLCQTSQVLRGKYSMGTTTGTSYILAGFPAQTALFTTFLFEIASFSNHTGGFPIVRFTSAASPATLDVLVDSATGLHVASNGIDIGLGSVQIGVVYRVGLMIDLKNGLDVQGQMVTGATTDFGPMFSRIGGGAALGALDHVALGSISADGMVAVFDHLLIDGTALPPP